MRLVREQNSSVIGRINTGMRIRSDEEARLKVQQAQLAEKLAARNPGGRRRGRRTRGHG